MSQNIYSFKRIHYLTLLVLILCSSQGFCQSSQVNLDTSNIVALQNSLLETFEGHNIFIRINQPGDVYHWDYVYFVHPIIPFVTKDGIIYVPFLSFVDLLGSQEERYEKYQVDLQHQDKIIVLRSTSDLYDIFDRSIGVISSPIGGDVIWLEDYQDALVPLEELLQVLDVPYTWDPFLNIFDIYTSNALTDTGLMNNYYLQGKSSSGYPTQAILPKSIKIMYSPQDNATQHLSFYVQLQEFPGIDIPETSLEARFGYNRNATGFIGIPLPSNRGNHEPPCPRESDHIFGCTFTPEEDTIPYLIGKIGIGVWELDN